MAKTKRPPEPEYRKNSYSDDDMKALLDVLDEKDDEAKKIMASAMGEVAAIRKWQKAEIKRAKDQLGIPTGVLKPLRKMRALEKQMRKVADEVAEDLIEVFEDAVENFGLFADTPLAQAATAAASAQKAAIAKRHEEEQAEGARALEELAQVH